MEIFEVVALRLVPLYLLVLAGFVLGRKLDVSRESVASVLIYFLSPLVVFNGAATARLGLGGLSLPVVIFTLACLICLTVLKFGRRLPGWGRGSTPYLAAFAAGNANSGYFGLPVALAILGERSLGLAVMASFGFILYENTLGYFVTARGQSSASDSLRKMLRLPAAYAFAAGLLANLAGFRIAGGVLEEFFRNVRGAYSVLGMMMIGLGVAGLKRFRIDRQFLAVTFLAKFAVWPFLILCLVRLDQSWVGLWSPDARKILVLLSCVPLAANTVAIAATLNVEPEKAGVAVLLSTAFALFYIPLIALFLL